MSVIAAIILGGLVGWVASKMLGRDEGILMSVVIGVVGSFIGGMISGVLAGGDKSVLAFSWVGLFWSLIGSIVLVAIMNAVSRPHHHTV